MVFMPETPRWLLQHSRRNEAGKVIVKVYENLTAREVNQVIAGIEAGYRPIPPILLPRNSNFSSASAGTVAH